MKSANFEILEDRWPELAQLGAFAESYVFTDPASAMMKLRLYAENLTKNLYRDLRLPSEDRMSFVDMLSGSAFQSAVPSVVVDKLHAIRMHGNKAAHGEKATHKTTLWLIKEAHSLARWLVVVFKRAKADDLPLFQELDNPVEGASKTELQREKRRTLEQLAAKEAQMSALLKELEDERGKTKAAEAKAEELSEARASGETAASELEFDEATTRARIIDTMLADVGWKVANGLTSTDQVAKELEVDGQPTETGRGYVDYVLRDQDGTPLAVVEAKRTSKSAELGRQQAKLYADSLEKKHGVRPAIFYTNGHDIWLWDDAGGFPPRKVFGYYSPDSLQYLVRFQRANKQTLTSLSSNKDIAGRLYQVETIKRVSERFEDKHRKALIVQATGTGKTRVAIALTQLMIQAKWAKRVLFLCDRKELRKQAKNAFNNFLPHEPIRVVNSAIRGDASEHIFFATYPSMLRAYQSFDVGFFDLIIADESHRSIYNVYGDLFHYFDCHQVGLTATPVDFVTRSTFDLFKCEGQHPTANYELEQAIEEGYLTPFEVYEHTTKFLRDGIKLEGLSAAQRRQLEEQGEDPDQFDYSAEVVDNAIFNKDTNRAVLRNLMENGICDAGGQTVGKTIIFARSHKHAVLLRELFDELYPQYGGRFCQVIDNYDPRAEQLIDDFKGEGKNDDLTIAISVDMLDTGIDVPEIVNLVFAKPIRSPVKFWQMVGRGTRLCEDLFGPGQDKSVFRIFDHWGNFERFEAGYAPAEPRSSKSLLQQLFEQRIDLAELALRKSEIATFDIAAQLITADVAALPEKSISVREKWRETRQFSKLETVKAFAPTAVTALRQTIAPLMQWRNVRGKTEAHAFDLLVTRLQAAVLKGSSDVEDLKADMMANLDALQMHLNPVRERADVIKEVKSTAFWSGISPEALERVRIPLREIIHHHDRKAGPTVPAKVIDVAEEQSEFQYGRRETSYTAVEMKAFKQAVDAELKKHIDTNPILQKIRTGEPVTETDLQAIVSLVLTQNPELSQTQLEEFFSPTAENLLFNLREMTGLDPATVKARFADFVSDHPALSAKQTRFLNLLQNHLIKFGVVTVDRLFDQPFTVVDANGLDGVFEEPDMMAEITAIISHFAPPSPKDMSAEDTRTTS
jgi:type I restriction enzyme R subunit